VTNQIAESLHEQWPLFKKHHPVGAYLPVGQLDGDCRCGKGAWPCAEVMAVLSTLVTPNHYAALAQVSTEETVVPYSPAPAGEPKGMWRHQDDMSHCSSYPDSFDWTYVESEWTCSTHDRVMVCVRREDG
jgi:hypothetical protein